FIAPRAGTRGERLLLPANRPSVGPARAVIAVARVARGVLHLASAGARASIRVTLAVRQWKAREIDAGRRWLGIAPHRCGGRCRRRRHARATRERERERNADGVPQQRRAMWLNHRKGQMAMQENSRESTGER